VSPAALERHRLGREVALVAAFNAVLLAWLLVRPGDHLLFLVVERALVVAGPGLGIAWCGRHLYDAWRGSGADRAGRRLRCLPVLVGIGLAIYPEDATDRDTLLQAADSAMYTAKDRGRDQVCAPADARVPRPLQTADVLAA
jgi:hypothetical protein